MLNDISITITKGQKIGIVGTTGAGKTTFVDLLLGLYKVQDGSILIDGHPLSNDRLDAFRHNLSYVSQSICLFDDTIKANITFGQPYQKRRMIDACQKAAIDDFILSDLPDGYDTIIGERGVTLSGGQRQRLGIARALYRQSDILILDEATSALDNETEDRIMKTIYASDQTVIIVAHRLSTLKGCDVIYLFDKGRIVDSGSFQSLKKSNQQFKDLIEKATI